MNGDELRACITYANGIDPRVQMTHPNAELWGRAVGHREAIEVTTAILVYYERPHPAGRERPPVGASDVRKIIQYESERKEARETAGAITAGPTRTIGGYRSADPERWDRLVQQGRDQYRADLKARGITPHAESCPECQRANRRTEAVPTGAASSIPGGEQ